MTPSLYRPLNRHLELLRQIEEAEGVMGPELEQQFTLTSGNVQERTETLLDFRDTVDGLIAAAEAKIAQAVQFIAQQKKAREHVDAALLAGVKLLGPIQAGTRKVSVRASDAVEITDDALLPHAFRRPIKVAEKGEPDRNLIKAAIKRGEPVPGAQLEQRSSLQVK